MLNIAIMGNGRMGSLIRQTAEAMRDADQNPVFNVVAQIGFALVNGTTGYSVEEMERLRVLGNDGAVLHSGNYSIGVAALRHLTAQATRELPGFDVEICETHHNQKFDAPSGTANLLLDAVMDAQAAAGRGGTVAGVHTVSFFGPDEEVTLTHRAGSRQIFVNGALAAALKMATRQPGFYTFDQVMFE